MTIRDNPQIISDYMDPSLRSGFQKKAMHQK
jgi:hypothetical protein